MPTVTRVAIRLALLQLVLAMALWTGLPLVAPHTNVPVMIAARAAWHLLAVGWLTQLIFGVAFWLFPTHKTTPRLARWWCGGSSVLAATSSKRWTVKTRWRFLA